MPPQNTKEFNLKFIVSGDNSGGSKALQDIATQAKKAEEAANRAGKAIADASRVSGSAGPGRDSMAYSVGAMGQTYDPLVGAIRELTGAIRESKKTQERKSGAGSKALEGTGAHVGALGAARAGLTVGAAAVGVVAFGAELVANLTRAIQGLENPAVIARERMVGLAEAIPLVGHAIGDLQRNVWNALDRLTDSETAKRVDRMKYEQPIVLGEKAARAAYEQRSWRLENEVQSARFRAQALGAVPNFDFAAMGYNSTFQNESLAIQRQFPRGSALPGGMGPLALGPLTRQLAIPGMPEITLPGTAGVGINRNEGGLSTLFQQYPELHSAFESLQNARRAADAGRREVGNSEAEAEAARASARNAERFWKSRVSESERRFTEAKRSDFSIGVSVYDKLRRSGENQLVSGIVGAYSYAAPEWVGADVYLTGKERKSSPTHLKEAAYEEEKALLDLKNRQADYEAKISKHKEDQLNYARQQYGVAQAEVGVQKAQLSIVDAQIAKAKSGVEEFGAMDKLSRATLQNALERFSKGGRQAITDQEGGLLASNPLTSEYFHRNTSRDAANDPLLKDINRITGQQDLNTLQGQRNQLEKEITVKVQEIDIKFADIIAERTKESNDYLRDIAKTLKEIAIRKPSFEALQGAIQSSGGS